MKTYDSLSDEELILLTRCGDINAYSLLVRRFCGPSRNCDIYRAAPEILQRYSLWEVSSVLLATFWDCLDGYRFGTVRFHTYYISALRYNLFRYDNQHAKEKAMTTSIDASVKNDDEYTLHDILSTNDPNDDPRHFLNYYETLKSFDKLPKEISPITLEIARMKINGLTFVEIAEALNMTYRQVYTRYQKFIDKAKSLIKHPDE